MSERRDQPTASKAEDRDVAVASPGFRAAIAVAVTSLLLFSPFILIGLGWFLEEYQEADGVSAVSHRVHEISFGLLFAIAVVGAWSQRRDARRNVAGMQQLILSLTVFTVLVSLTVGKFEWLPVLFFVPIVIAVWLHPARRQLLVPPLRPWKAGFVMTAIATLASIDVTIREIERTVAQAQDHTSHWAAMAAFFVSLLLLSLLAALRPPGYRTTAATIGVVSILFGVASLLYPFDASARANAAVFWIGWGAVWMLLASRRARRSEAAVQLRPGVFPLLRRTLVRAFSVLGILILSVSWAVIRGTPRIPHNLEDVPGVGRVAFSEITRATCLTCHVTGERGAPVVTHPRETCFSFEQDCFFNKVHCLGCHQLNPALIDTEGANALRFGRAMAVPTGPPSRLSADAVALLRDYVAGLNTP